MKNTEEYKVDQKTAIHGMREEAKRINELFSSLNAIQINWKPAPKAWSIGQCLDHLIITHSRYNACFNDLIEGKEMNSWQRINPFSGILGNQILKSVVPENIKKSKTFPVFEPSQSEIRPDIVIEYTYQLEGFLHWFDQIRDLDADKIMISSPVNKWITYSLRDACSILYHHDRRHIDQALRVMQHEGFPKT